MIFRVEKNLSTGPNLSQIIHAGSTIRGDRFKPKVVQALELKGAITPISAPPLNVFHGWELRSIRFGEAGYDAVGILETDDTVLADNTGYNVESIKKWKTELRELLGLTGEKLTSGCTGCG